jgi:protein-arginine kinase activator protein McsA
MRRAGETEQQQAERYFARCFVKLPVCPDCDRVMKPQAAGAWKCCAICYETVEEALCAYGMAAGDG